MLLVWILKPKSKLLSDVFRISQDFGDPLIGEIRADLSLAVASLERCYHVFEFQLRDPLDFAVSGLVQLA